MSACGTKYIYLHKAVNNLHYYCFVPSLCKSWSCPVCRLKKAKIVQQYIQDNFAGSEVYMLSFTLYHSGDPCSSWKYISEYWNRLRTSVAKKSGKFSYMRVIEPHRDGTWPHMHVLIKGSERIYELFDKSVQCGFGWNCHSKHISVDVASRYVSKYLTKTWPDGNAEFFRVLNKTRIVSVSRDLPAIFNHKTDWECCRYDDMSERTPFYLNVLIDLLKKKQAIFIESKPFLSGFLLISETFVDFEAIISCEEPYIWEKTNGLNYLSCEYGLQLELEFEATRSVH